jgi:hypothetical protein
MNRKPLAVWQNILLAIPIGVVGGALAGAVSVTPFGFNVSSFYGEAAVGGIIGLATFPLAYATVARTRSVFTVVPAGLGATVLGIWIDFGLLSALWSKWPTISEKLGVSQFLVALLLPVIAMFGACAWAAARERRKFVDRQSR